MSISEADLECYKSLKPKLLEQLRHGKDHIVTYQCYISNSMLGIGRVSKTGEKGMVGLVNQGATCYLNALLKVLFNVGAFRSAIFESQSESGIIVALQKLFGLLSSSNRYAVSTKELTAAFGWSNAEVFDQHDAMELFSVLLDAVEKECALESDVFTKMFRGLQTDVLKCPSGSHQSETEASFLDIPLHFPESSSQRHELYELLNNYSADECLSAENAVECSDCQKRVQATKSVVMKSLPGVLMFNLKRITYDMVRFPIITFRYKY